MGQFLDPETDIMGERYFMSVGSVHVATGRTDGPWKLVLLYNIQIHLIESN